MSFSEIELCGRFKGTIFSWTVLCMLPIGLLLFLIAFFTDSWSKVYVVIDEQPLDIFVTSGLWKRCDHIEEITYCRSLIGSQETSGEFITCQALNSFSLLSVLIAIIATCAYHFIQRFQRDQRTAITIATLLLTSVLFGTVGCILFPVGDQKDMRNLLETNVVYHYGWGFGLAAAYNITLLFLAAFIVIEIKNSRNMIPA